MYSQYEKYIYTNVRACIQACILTSKSNHMFWDNNTDNSWTIVYLTMVGLNMKGCIQRICRHGFAFLVALAYDGVPIPKRQMHWLLFKSMSISIYHNNLLTTSIFIIQFEHLYPDLVMGVNQTLDFSHLSQISSEKDAIKWALLTTRQGEPPPIWVYFT